MIRKLTLCMALMLATASIAMAKNINGLRIESLHARIIVLIDGQQVCLPTQSCFVANLKGTYHVEVYEVSGIGKRWKKGKKLYNERIRCNGKEVKEIRIDDTRSGWSGPTCPKPARPGGIDPIRIGVPVKAEPHKK